MRIRRKNNKRKSFMVSEQIEKIIHKNVDFNTLKKDQGIIVFYEEGDISIGVSFETDDDGNDGYIYNLFWQDDEYINISNTGNNYETYTEIADEWNNLMK